MGFAILRHQVIPLQIAGPVRLDRSHTGNRTCYLGIRSAALIQFETADLDRALEITGAGQLDLQAFTRYDPIDKDVRRTGRMQNIQVGKGNISPHFLAAVPDKSTAI